MINKRRHIRFRPESGAHAAIDLNTTGGFKPVMAALIFQESHGGAGLLVVSELEFQEGQRLRAKVGNLSPMEAIVRWVSRISDDVYKIGIEYTE
jgi:hypothetical protein